MMYLGVSSPLDPIERDVKYDENNRFTCSARTVSDVNDCSSNFLLSK